METFHHAPVVRLVGNVLELEDDISLIENYLSKPIAKDDKDTLPLGTIGKVMAQQLHTESRSLTEKAELLQTRYVHGWDLAKHSSALHKKVMLVMTLAGMIAQLPPSNLNIRLKAGQLTQRIIDQCHRIEYAIDAVTAAASATAIISRPENIPA